MGQCCTLKTFQQVYSYTLNVLLKATCYDNNYKVKRKKGDVAIVTINIFDGGLIHEGC